MGHYISQTDLEARRTEADLIALVDDEGSGSLTDEGQVRIAAAITDAEGEVDALLSQGGLEVPISPVPDRLVTLTSTIAWWYLCVRRRTVPKKDEAAYEAATKAVQRMAETGAHGGDDDPAMRTTRRPRRGAVERQYDDDTMTGL